MKRSTTAGLGTELAKAHGRGDGAGGRLDTRGQVAVLKARQRGVTDPDELRALARAAKS
jgi:hypothetical protein